MAAEDSNAEELRQDLAKWKAALVEAEASAAKVVALRSLVKTLTEALSVIEGKPLPSHPSPHRYARMRLPEAIVAYLEEHRSSVDIQKELLPALLDGGAMTGKRKPEKPLKDSKHPLQPLMIAIQALARNARVAWDEEAGTVELRR